MRWENGDVKKMDMNKVELLAKALKCNPAYIMGWQDIDAKYQLIELYDQATETDKEEIVSFVKFKLGNKKI